MKNKVIALDIGGTSMRAAIVDNGKVHNYHQIKTPKTKLLFLKKINELIKNLDSSDVSGIGVGIASPLKNGILKNPPNLPLKNFNLKKFLEKEFKKRVEIKNDAGCFALAEFKKNPRYNNFILLTIGTGIGGGIIINGKEYRGRGHGAEFGHIYIRGKEWELLWKETRKKIKKEFGEEKLIRDLVKMKNKKTKKLLDEVADYFGEGIASLISVFDPDVVLIGGGIRDAGDVFLKSLRKKIKKYSFLQGKTPVYWTGLEHPGIVGASLLLE
ncbi:ROK family protein [Candidatus Pacearchaeota archaeon]|nr:ROK family protein [Candidatus Pacearchaeota archaeon]